MVIVQSKAFTPMTGEGRSCSATENIWIYINVKIMKRQSKWVNLTVCVYIYSLDSCSFSIQFNSYGNISLYVFSHPVSIKLLRNPSWPCSECSMTKKKPWRFQSEHVWFSQPQWKSTQNPLMSWHLCISQLDNQSHRNNVCNVCLYEHWCNKVCKKTLFIV